MKSKDRGWDSAFLVNSTRITELERRELVELLDDICAEFSDNENMPWQIADRITKAYLILGVRQ